jgi:hypothetical protein
MDTIDISPSLEALEERLTDNDNTVQRTAVQALGYFHAQRGHWREIDRLLGKKPEKQGFIKKRNTMCSEARQSLIALLYGFVTRFNISSDIPSLIKAMAEPDTDIRRNAFALLLRAAEQDRDISTLVPILEKAGADDDARVRESANLALKTRELKRDSGRRCPACLDCELGIGPGRESESLNVRARILKRMSCCAGELSQTLYICTRCRKYFVSLYYDHTGFHSEQHIIEMISRNDAEKVIAEIKKCRDPENPDCNCPVHRKFLEKEKIPVKGSRKYELTID